MSLKCEFALLQVIFKRALSQNFHRHIDKKVTQKEPILLEDGVFAVCKPKDLSSTETVEIIKNTLMTGIPANSRDSFKVGHGGVLDKTASGVLAVGVGSGCKLLPNFLYGVKEYVVTGCLGTATTTYNSAGDVTKEMPYDHVTREGFLQVLDKFRGQVTQTPPVYSALKLQGRRYSDLARDGVEVTPKPRLVKCYDLVCTNFEPPFFSLRIKCGRGFYVRSLINELGIELGSCAHVQALNRTQHGAFKEHDAISRCQWTLEEIIQCIRKAKISHWYLFNDLRPTNVKGKGREKYAGSERERRIKFTDNMFDL